MTSRPDPIGTIEAWLAAEAVDRAPQVLLDRTQDRIRVTGQRGSRAGMSTWRSRAWASAGIALAGVIVIALVALDLGLPRSAVVGPSSTSSPSPGSTPGATPIDSPSSMPVPSRAAADRVYPGLPGPRGGPAGRYGWRPDDNGWMHNPGDGPGVDMFFTMLDPDLRVHPGQTPFFVAGHMASYEEYPNTTGGVTRLWVVAIDGTRIAIRVESRPDTIDADVAEAVAIVQSIEVAPDDHSAFGFMLTFLVPDGWDSG